MDDVFRTTPHRRWNPLKREWVLVSPHRALRPWQGQMEKPAAPPSIAFDPSCYLCPGNTRAGGQQTPAYTGTYIFENDFAALRPNEPLAQMDTDAAGLLRAQTERGVCRVICFDPRHDLTLATMDIAAIERVVDAWTSQSVELGSRPDIGYVQIFENRGAMMGASNPHPHGQVWATEHVPNEPALELAAQLEYASTHPAGLLADYLNIELQQNERIVAQNETWVALVPFWAVWPFELMVLPRRRVAQLAELTPEERTGLAGILQTVTRGYNRVFDTPFPYSMGLHPA
ncbi:MAG TPA: galactose-1-phosphate uridylyltransferase, partial [Acidobacteriaceae bacterium]